MQSGGFWYGATFKDLDITGFTGGSAVGWKWINPANTQSERVLIEDVQIGDNNIGNTIGIQFVDTSGGIAFDFSYWDVIGLRMTIANTQTGIDLENDSDLSGSNWRAIINTDATSGTTTIFNIAGTSHFGSDYYLPPQMNNVWFNLDASALTGTVVVWNVASGATVRINGPVEDPLRRYILMGIGPRIPAVGHF
jgi:hypothetical protein